LGVARFPQAVEALAQVSHTLAGFGCLLAQGRRGLAGHLLIQRAACGLLRAAGKLT
jgi:hypothetical protein